MLLKLGHPPSQFNDAAGKKAFSLIIQYALAKHYLFYLFYLFCVKNPNFVIKLPMHIANRGNIYIGTYTKKTSSILKFNEILTV